MIDGGNSSPVVISQSGLIVVLYIINDLETHVRVSAHYYMTVHFIFMLNKMIDTVHAIPFPYSKSQRLRQRPLPQRSPEGKQKTTKETSL